MLSIALRSFAASLFVLGLVCSPASSYAQSSQAYQNNLLELSETLGRIHSIRVTCNGQSDQYWRRFMMNFLDLEAPEPGYLRSQMVDRFNSAFTSESSRFPKCSVEATRAEQELTQYGEQLTDRLSAEIAGY
ncbi:MAG: TIGR02301 family protein [Ponticaulis sp.]|nr:TIGR02301 family protein [Ponticaulis sp.]|tara:strand:+ start:13282 stop:13677 length:396 start_codon:yes stop_codon:yes gene_type:complete